MGWAPILKQCFLQKKKKKKKAGGGGGGLFYVCIFVCLFGVLWCGVVWCGVVCRRRCYQMAMAGMVLHPSSGVAIAECPVQSHEWRPARQRTHTWLTTYVGPQAWQYRVWRGVPKALLPEGNGRDVYPRVQVTGRAVCLSARCVLVCCCTVGTSAQLHLARAALLTPMHGHTGSTEPTTPCVALHYLFLTPKRLFHQVSAVRTQSSAKVR